MATSDGFIDSLKQQKLSSRHFSFGPTFVFSLTFFLGILCIGIGIVLTHAASSIKEQAIDYTNRTDDIVELSVNLTDFEGNVFVYYQLERFPQLHYSMRNSYDMKHFMEGDYSFQCTGETDFQREMRRFTDYWMSKIFYFLFPQENSIKRIRHVPCGQRANFFFNDTLGNIYDPKKKLANFTRTNIAWPKIREYFKNNITCNSSDLCSFFNDEEGLRYPKPANWKTHICKMENGMENEDFIVWMTPAYATTFRKLWKQFIKKDQINGSMYENGIPNGIYTVAINNTWKIRNNVYGNYLFNKSIVFSTANWAGGKNNFLGYAYLIVGVTILLFSCGLAIMQSIKPSYLVYETEEHIRRRKTRKKLQVFNVHQLKMSLMNFPKPAKIDDSDDTWMALMFPGEIITYHTSPKYNLPTAVARMSVGDSAMMKWNGIEYEASCILIGTEKKCERLVYKLVEGYMHPCELNIPPQLLDDHCRMCLKKISGKHAVLIHQLEHTVNTCPILLCGHNFKDVSRMENHLQRHVEGNIKIKLETDDEGCNDHLLRGKTKKFTKMVKKMRFEEDEDSLDENGNERPKKELNISRVEKRQRTMDEKRSMDCPICSRSFLYEKSYEKHIAEHNEEKEKLT